ncbi:MAG: hypothetical protein H6567_11865 [Lewinellaceae bacterium]|nr:hypothetical protein [Lewinellaceae bacterium]
MKALVQNKVDISDLNVTITKNLTEKYKANPSYNEKLQWAKDFLKNRDLNKELKELKEKERITKP